MHSHRALIQFSVSVHVHVSYFVLAKLLHSPQTTNICKIEEAIQHIQHTLRVWWGHTTAIVIIYKCSRYVSSFLLAYASVNTTQFIFFLKCNVCIYGLLIDCIFNTTTNLFSNQMISVIQASNSASYLFLLSVYSIIASSNCFMLSVSFFLWALHLWACLLTFLCVFYREKYIHFSIFLIARLNRMQSYNWFASCPISVYIIYDYNFLFFFSKT